MAKRFSVCLRTKWLWVRIPLRPHNCFYQLKFSFVVSFIGPKYHRGNPDFVARAVKSETTMHEQEDLFLVLYLMKTGDPRGSPLFFKFSSRNKSSCSCMEISLDLKFTVNSMTELNNFIMKYLIFVSTTTHSLF